MCPQSRVYTYRVAAGLGFVLYSMAQCDFINVIPSLTEFTRILVNAPTRSGAYVAYAKERKNVEHAFK